MSYKKKIKKLHIAIDCRMINSSGIGTYLKNILPGIIRSDFYVTVMGRKKELISFEWFQDTHFISLLSKILTFGEQFELPIKVPACDIYWSPNINGAICFTRAKHRITTVHDVFHLANPQRFSKVKILFVKILLKSAILHSENIITVSNFSKKQIMKYTGCSPDKIHVSYLAAEDELHKNFETKIFNTPYFLFVGNVKPHKNLETALKAFKEIEDESYKFIIVGKKDGFITGYSNTDTLIINLSGRVEFTGYIEDKELKNYYKNAKALIFPSLYEGFGLPVLEAMKFNIPIIASNVSAIPEVGGNAIEYFNPHDAEELRGKMIRIIKGEIRVDKNKYERQLKNFSWSKTISEHISVFEKACGK